MATRGGDGGGDESNRPTTTDTTTVAANKAQPRPPRPAAPGDDVPGVGRVVDIRRAYDRYLSVDQMDVAVFDGGDGGARGRGGVAEEKHAIVSYDVVSHPRSQRAFIVVFPFHPPATSREGRGGASRAVGGRGAGVGSARGDGEDPPPSRSLSTPSLASPSLASPSLATPSLATPSPTLPDAPEVTLLREYCQGVNSWLYTLPTGGYDPSKHGEGGIGVAARAELSEEARLEGGTWECLLPDEREERRGSQEGADLTEATFPNPLEAGVPESKWCANRFWPYLCVGPSDAASPPPKRDSEEEGTIEVLRVTLPVLRSIVARGRMLLPSVQASWMAIERLRELGHAVD